jgi:hypothetical protein
MSPQEWFWELDAKIKTNREIQEATQSGGKFTGPKWEEARRKHREKMKAKADD